MYEARRQRSSWARIKLSIVRKVMSIIRRSGLLDFILLSVSFFSKSTGIYRFQLFNFQCSISLEIKVSKMTFCLFHIPLNFSVTLSSDISYLITSFFVVNNFFKIISNFFEVYFSEYLVSPLAPFGVVFILVWLLILKMYIRYTFQSSAPWQLPRFIMYSKQKFKSTHVFYLFFFFLNYFFLFS